jgi:hypothetical protein
LQFYYYFRISMTANKPVSPSSINVHSITCGCESSASFLAYLTQSYCHHWASVVCRPSSVVRRPSVRPSVKFPHFNQLLWSHWANLNQTLVEWSLDGPLPKLCPVIPTSNQDGRQAKNRKKGDGILIVHCCFSINQNELKF